MLSEKFYESFSEYKYMLIHQSDAYLFNPKLQYWCDQDYDYLGAPWLRSANTSFKIKVRIFKLKYLSFLYSEEERDIKRSYLIYNQVGNGGLSLRKINTFIDVLKKIRDQKIKKYREISEFNYLEDAFWSIEAPKVNNRTSKLHLNSL